MKEVGLMSGKLLQFAKENDNIEEALLGGNDGELLYHFSPIRRNVLDWFMFDNTDSVLQLFAECGQVTGLLCEKCARVVAVEENSEYAEVNRYVNRNFENLEIINKSVDLFIDEKLDIMNKSAGTSDYKYIKESGETTFDYVVVLGSLRDDLLSKLKAFLKPGGAVILAVDNKYGIKYWSGYPSGSKGEAFASLEGLANDADGRSISKNGLESLLYKAGFVNNEFYYPIPDYKLPMEIYAEEYLPKKGVLKMNTPSYDRDRLLTFDETLVADTLASDGIFDYFANSYLVICRLEV